MLALQVLYHHHLLWWCPPLAKDILQDGATQENMHILLNLLVLSSTLPFKPEREPGAAVRLSRRYRQAA